MRSALPAAPPNPAPFAGHSLARALKWRCGERSNPMSLSRQGAGPSLLRMLYFRPDRASLGLLDEKVFDFAARHRDSVRLVVRHSDECGFLFGRWVDGRTPTVLFVRDGQALADIRGDAAAQDLERIAEAALVEQQAA
jgi:hypothetical protein